MFLFLNCMVCERYEGRRNKDASGVCRLEPPRIYVPSSKKADPEDPENWKCPAVKGGWGCFRGVRVPNLPKIS